MTFSPIQLHKTLQPSKFSDEIKNNTKVATKAKQKVTRCLSALRNGSP